MKRIRVLLAEDHTIVRKGLRLLLDAESDIEVIGEAEDGREAIRKVEKLHPNIVVMDIAMPGLNGLEATRRIKKRFPDVEILILSMHATEEYIFQILRAGALGCVVKQSAPSELVSAIKNVWQGELFLSATISKRVIAEFIQRGERTTEQDSHDQLTDREREVLQLIAEGHSNRQIAESLHISVKTVETHRAHVMDKLDIRGTAGLTRYAIRTGIISLEP